MCPWADSGRKDPSAEVALVKLMGEDEIWMIQRATLHMVKPEELHFRINSQKLQTEGRSTQFIEEQSTPSAGDGKTLLVLCLAKEMIT